MQPNPFAPQLPAQPYTPQFGQPMAQPQPGSQAPQPSPLEAKISQLEAKYADSTLALNDAMARQDIESARKIAMEQAQYQGQLTSAYVQQQNEQQAYSTRLIAGVTNQYQTGLTQAMTQYLGVAPSQAEVAQYGAFIQSLLTPESAQSMQNPEVQQFFLKAYLFDRMQSQPRQGGMQRAPRDYVPNIRGEYVPNAPGAPAGFMPGLGGQTGPSFEAMTPDQRLSFMSGDFVQRGMQQPQQMPTNPFAPRDRA